MTVNQKAITKHVVALVMALIMLVLLPVNAFAHSSGGGSHSGGADLTSDSNKTYAYYPDCGLYFASTGSVPLIASSDISAYFSSFPNPSILYSHLHVLYNNSSYPDVSIYPDYIVYISTWGRATVVFFDYNSPRWSKITLSNNVLHFEGMEQKNYFIISGIYCSNSSVDSFGHYGTYIYPAQNMQYGQTKSLDDNFSGNINDNVYSSNCVNIISSSVPVYTTDGETVFEPDEPPGTFEEEEEENTTEYPELSDNVYQDPHEGEQAPSFPSVSDYDNIFDFMKHFLPDAFRWLGNVIVWYLQEIRYYLAFIVERLHGMLVYFRSLFVVLTNNLEVMFNNLSSALVRYVNGIITRMNYLNSKLLNAIAELKDSNVSASDRIVNAVNAISTGSSSSSFSVDMTETNLKLDTINSTLDGLNTINSSIHSVGSSLSSLSSTIRESIFSISNVSNGVFEEGYNVANGLVQIIKEGILQARDSVSDTVTTLVVPDSDNVNEIIETNVPVVGQVRNAFIIDDDNPEINGQFMFKFEIPGFEPHYFSFVDIPVDVRNAIYSKSTMLAYVFRFFLVIKIFFKAFDVQIKESEGG